MTSNTSFKVTLLLTFNISKKVHDRTATSSSAVAKRPRNASGLSVCFVASIMQYLERIFLLLVTSASDLLVRTIRFRSVVFGVTSSLAVIHTRPESESERERVRKAASASE